MEVREKLYIEFKEEANRLLALQNDGKLTERILDDSYNTMLDYLDETYRGKDGGHDFSLDIIDIRNIVNLIEEPHKELIVAYIEVVNYLGE